MKIIIIQLLLLLLLIIIDIIIVIIIVIMLLSRRYIYAVVCIWHIIGECTFMSHHVLAHSRDAFVIIFCSAFIFIKLLFQ